jgi:hypothetical protein
MSYQYSDRSRETEPYALPDVEVFMETASICDVCGLVNFNNAFLGECEDCGADCPEIWPDSWWYAYGQIGCLWDSDPVGPFASEEEALESARDY